jgi:hypothetical protein
MTIGGTLPSLSPSEASGSQGVANMSRPSTGPRSSRRRSGGWRGGPVQPAVSEGAIDAHLEELDPEVDLGPVTVMAEGRAPHGREEVRRYLEPLHEVFAEKAVEGKSFEATAERIVVTLGRCRALGHTSGGRVDSAWAVAKPLRQGGNRLGALSGWRVLSGWRFAGQLATPHERFPFGFGYPSFLFCYSFALSCSAW